MRRFIVHVGWIFFCSLMIVAVGFIQFGIHYVIKDNHNVVSGVSCRLESIEGDEVVKLNLRCGKRFAYITSPKYVAAVLNNPGPFTCKLFETDRAECQRTGN